MRTADNKLAGRVNVVFDAIAKKMGVFFVFGLYTRDKNADDIAADFFKHSFLLVEIIVLR